MDTIYGVHFYLVIIILINLIHQSPFVIFISTLDVLNIYYAGH